jgi:hypothetical protein
MAWRLQRSVFLFFVVMAVVLIGFVIVNGLHTESLLHQWNSATCYGTRHGYITKSQVQCWTILQNSAKSMIYDRYFTVAGVLLCGVLGLLLGANLVASEIDRKTARAAWTQSVTRSRWFASKIIVSLGSLLVVGAPLCLTYIWWIGAVQYGSRVAPNAFAYNGWMPLATGVFAFSVATIIGILLRRPGWTLAAALAVMVLVMWTMQNEVRTSLVPLHSTTIGMTTLSKDGVTAGKPTNMAPQNAWVVFDGFVPLRASNAIPTWGQETPRLEAVNRCPSSSTNSTAYTACLKKLGLRDVELYVADDQFWTLQFREGGIYLAGAALLFGFSFWLLRRSKA